MLTQVRLGHIQDSELQALTMDLNKIVIDMFCLIFGTLYPDHSLHKSLFHNFFVFLFLFLFIFIFTYATVTVNCSSSISFLFVPLSRFIFHHEC